MSVAITNQFLSSTFKLLKEYHESGANAKDLADDLVGAFNKLVTGPLIDQNNLFDGVMLRPETQILMAWNPQGEALQSLNRLLLEDAYPLALARTVQVTDRPRASRSNLR